MFPNRPYSQRTKNTKRLYTLQSDTLITILSLLQDNVVALLVLTMPVVLGWPIVLVLPKEKPVVWAVVAWPKGLKRLFAWGVWLNKLPVVAPKPLVPTEQLSH